MQASDTRKSIQLTVLSFYYEAGVSIIDSQVITTSTISAYAILQYIYVVHIQMEGLRYTAESASSIDHIACLMVWPVSFKAHSLC